MPVVESYSSSNFRKHTSSNPLQRWLLQRFHGAARELLAQTDAHHILDAGCGEGFAMRDVLGRSNSRVVGLDGDVAAARVAYSLNPSKQFAAGNLLALPFPDNSFDLVVCMEVLEHLAQPRAGLAELCRVSATWLLLSVPNEPLFRGANYLRGKNVHDWGNDPGHVNHWSATAFTSFLASQCRVVTCRTSFPWTLALCRVD